MSADPPSGSGHGRTRLKVLEIGTGFACSYAGWALAAQGAHVVRALIAPQTGVSDRYAHSSWLHRDKEIVTTGDHFELLRNADCVITDRLDLVGPLASTDLPRPEGLEKLVVVELGPPAAEPNADIIIAAGSGIGAAIGESNGAAMTPPGHMLESLVALHGICAGLAGVVAARRDGVGEHIYIDPRACVAGIAGVAVIQYLNYGGRFIRDGRSVYKSGGPYPNRIFRAGDGWVVVICRSKDEWKAFLSMLGDPPWASDPRYEDPITVAKLYANEVTELVEQILAKSTVAQLWQRAKEFRVPLAPVRSIEDVIADENLITRDNAGNFELVPPIERLPNPNRAGSGRFSPKAVDGRQSPLAPLAGLKVLDLGWVWAAPIAGAWMGDLGADVIKVESLDRLDTSRRRGLEFPVGGPGSARSLPGYERAHLFSAANRNKRSVSLNIKDGPDHEKFLQLVRRAHVLIESFSGGVLERMGLTPPQLFSVNPDLIIVSLGGATIDGAYASRSYAPILSALAGLEGSVRDAKDEPLGMMGWAQADPNGGTWALLSVLYCLVQGISGVHLKASQLRGLVNSSASLFYDRTGAVPISGCAVEEITAEHIAGKAPGPLGDIFRDITVRHWDPTVGERISFDSPWQFKRMDVRVARAAPLFGNTSFETIVEEWSKA